MFVCGHTKQKEIHTSNARYLNVVCVYTGITKPAHGFPSVMHQGLPKRSAAMTAQWLCPYVSECGHENVPNASAA